uniref:Molybdopterin synthase sulfur carrier subunit n=1 Tax=Magnetococcus massalia (strain MO-1) TaxID=451514 RepID=A0A1S7LMP2_MAGMO|nr:Molybdopterin-converting factor subunit 1 [Candidatus Magnetococcus massalia]
MAKLLFFASVREKMGMPETELNLPTDVTTVGALISHLQEQGAPYSEALAGGHIQVAVNQLHTRPNDPVSDRDEIAFFPPVSGG